MKNFLIILALASLALAGGTQKEQPKKTPAKKSAAAKSSPTPKKKASTTAKKTPAPAKKSNTTPKKETERRSASTTNKKSPSKQKTTPSGKKTTAANEKPKPKPKAAAAQTKKDDKGDLDKALAIEDTEKKIAALAKFLTNYPKSGLRPRALESLTAARIAFGDAKFAAGDREAGLKLIRLAISEAPVPYTEKLFLGILSTVPAGLYARGEHAAAIEAAAAIEKNSTSSLPQLLALAGFHLSTENGDEAKRLAEAAIKLDEKSVAAHQTLGMAHRLNFDLEASASAFAKALEFEPESATVRRNLADLKRALGKSDEALALYSELLAKDAADLHAQTGRILALFEAGKRSDAETELSRSIEANGGNVILLAGAAWWYASRGESEKAIDLAGKAIAAEPRYIWSHIALARAFAAAGRLADAEQTLLKAKTYGNFATLEYELASVRFASGFYREAAEELQKSFIVKDGNVSTRLGRRIERSDKSFPDLLAPERRASILLQSSADNAENAERMKVLLELTSVLAASSPDAARAAELAGAFSKGTDTMRYHRQIFAADALLEKRIAPERALEISRSAVAGVDDGLSIAMPSAPIMANELYATRSTAFSLDRYVTAPELPKQTLSAIARGRIEEIAGRSLMQQGNNPDAVIRLRRAVSILPEKSEWWRSSWWRLGTALETDGKDKEALDAYIKSYSGTDGNAAKYSTIETVYKRINGGTDGLEALIGANPAKPIEKAADAPIPVETKKETNSITPEEKTSVKPENLPDPVKTDDKPAEQKKLTESVSEIPKSVPADAKKTDPVTADPKPIDTGVKSEAPVEQKPIEETVATPAAKSEDKQAEAKPTEEKKVDPPPVGNPRKADPQSVEERPKERQDEASPPATKVEEKPDESKKPAQKETPKGLFEPVVIEVKNQAKAKKETEESQNAEAKVNPQRDRVVEVKETASKAAPPPCSVTVSEASISLNADGGSIGILVGMESETELKQLTAAANSPKDVEVTRQPEIAGVSGRAFYVIRSLSNAAGDYTITFSAPCGKKVINVKVR